MLEEQLARSRDLNDTGKDWYYTQGQVRGGAGPIRGFKLAVLVANLDGLDQLEEEKTRSRDLNWCAETGWDIYDDGSEEKKARPRDLDAFSHIQVPGGRVRVDKPI